MSIVLEITRPAPIGTYSITIRNPEFGDTFTRDRPFAVGETEGGKQFIQDLGFDREFYEATWTNLSRCECEDLERFFSEEFANKRLRKFLLKLVDNTNISLGIGTGQGLATGTGLTTGDRIVSAVASLGEWRLNQSELQITAIPKDRYTVSLSFRRVKPPCN